MATDGFGINFRNGQALVKATDAIIAGIQEKALAHSPWSLAELSPDDKDHQWLLQWADDLEYETVRTWISSLVPYRANEWNITRQAAFGLIFLFFASEVARRDATEGHLWKFICKTSGKTPRFNKRVEELLFAQGQPTYELKQAIAQAASTFNLRNVFGISGLMNWFDTVFLQFGFTQRGLEDRLPFWLAGYGTTQAISSLLLGQSQSSSFAALWHHLQEVRRGNITAGQFQQRVQGSPWLLTELYDKAPSFALRRPNLGTAPAPNVGTPENLEAPFLETPMLQWNQAPSPAFVTHFQNLLDQPLDETHYTLIIAGKEYATLVRQDDGTYNAIPDTDIILPIIAPTVVASLVQPDGTTVRNQSLSLYDPADEVTAFRSQDGTRISDAWSTPLNPDADLILLISADLTLSPLPPRWARLPDSSGCFYHLTRGWNPDTRVLLGDGLFWKPVIAQGQISAEPPWTKSVQVQWRRSVPEAAMGLKIEGPVGWLTVNHSADVEVKWVRTGGESLTQFINPVSGRVSYGPAPLYDGNMERRIRLRLMQNVAGEEHTAVVCRTLSTRLAGGEGAMRQTSNGWVPMGAGTRLSVWEARTTPVRLVTPFAWGGFGPQNEFGLIEGEAWIGNAARFARPLGRLSGWGGSLELRPRPYNSFADRILLSEEVYDTGDMADAYVSLNEECSRQVTIKLHEIKEPDKDFQILWWSIGGELFSVSGNEVSILDERSWQCDIPLAASEPIVIAISYQGIRRGAWWRKDWCEQTLILAERDPAQWASLIRYFKLPLCAPEHLPRVQARLHAFPGETLAAWLGNEGLPDGLCQQVDLGWNPTLRTLTSGWSPTLTAAKKLVTLLGKQGTDFEEQLLLTADRLTAICPFIAAHTLRVYRDEMLLPQRGQIETKRILLNLCCRFLELPPEAKNADIQNQTKALIATTAEMLGLGIVDQVNTAFVSSRQGGLLQKAIEIFEQKPVDEVHRDNLDIAFATVEPLRRLVAATLIQRLIP
jgi:hypothetical protein